MVHARCGTFLMFLPQDPRVSGQDKHAAYCEFLLRYGRHERVLRALCRLPICTRYHPKASGNHPQAFGNTRQSGLR